MGEANKDGGGTGGRRTNDEGGKEIRSLEGILRRGAEFAENGRARASQLSLERVPCQKLPMHAGSPRGFPTGSPSVTIVLFTVAPGSYSPAHALRPPPTRRLSLASCYPPARCRVPLLSAHDELEWCPDVS